MAVGQKYWRTNFEEDDNASTREGTPTGVLYDPELAFHDDGTSFCQRRSPTEKLSFLAICVLVIVVVSLVIVLCSQYNTSSATLAITVSHEVTSSSSTSFYNGMF